MCRYHMQWDLFVAALYNVRKTLRDKKVVVKQGEEELRPNIRCHPPLRCPSLKLLPSNPGTHTHPIIKLCLILTPT